jgi:hypothetical protein
MRDIENAHTKHLMYKSLKGPTLCQGGRVGHGRCRSRSRSRSRRSTGHGNSGIEVHDWAGVCLSVCLSVSQSGEASPRRHRSKPHRNSPSFIHSLTHHLPVTLASAIKHYLKPNGNPNSNQQFSQKEAVERESV